MTSGSSIAYPVTPNDLTMNEHNIQKSLSQVLDSNTEDITEVWWRRLIENWPDQQLLLQSRHIQNDAIDSILKIQNIPPHWIFALDSLIRESVQEAQRLLHLCYKNVFEIEMAGSEVAVPQSANSDMNHQLIITTTAGGGGGGVSPTISADNNLLRHSQESLFNMQLIKSDHFKQEIKHLLQENNKTVKLLSDTFTEYLTEQNEVLRHLCEKVRDQNRPTNFFIDLAHDTSVDGDIDTDDNDGKCCNKDETLITMLEQENINRSTIDALIRQDIDRKVLFEFISRDDLRKLNLTLGDELRLWNLIERNRVCHQLVNNNNKKDD
ncbi:hypothetical protein BLA29_004829 [Euroglyphus maynei]|uniref:MAP3K HisK-N-like globin domain-containing protein n=1 Tax=Euroglyphus maynei TaxID=6958 RepID=A0A1Y3AMM0_EURMA|nr:hypothetical protein BLA29_004829 [Euroglyphus maynei]